MILSKKAISETISFIFLTLIVVIFSSVAYYFLSGELDEAVSNIDRNNMEKNLGKFDFISRQMQTIDNTTVSFPISFKTGTLMFNDNQMIFQSKVKYSDTQINCFDVICYYGFNGYERILLNLSSSYSFSDDFSLTPGSYVLVLTNLKNESEIKINIR